jgi:uncharacterized coiled-coil DUF342 family protein
VIHVTISLVQWVGKDRKELRRTKDEIRHLRDVVEQRNTTIHVLRKERDGYFEQLEEARGLLAQYRDGTLRGEAIKTLESHPPTGG